MYLELIAYLLILVFGVIINVLVYSFNVAQELQFIVSIITSILVCGMMFLLGYTSAKNKKSIKKYLLVFILPVVFGVLTIIRTVLAIIGYEDGIGTVFIYANNIFIESAKSIFYCLKGIFNEYLGYFGIIITFIFMFIGTRVNVIVSKNKKEETDA